MRCHVAALTSSTRGPIGGSPPVVRDAQAAEALAEHGPALEPERLADELGVADDGVGAEVHEVVGGRVQPHRRRASGAALVERDHAEVLERPVEPARPRPRALVSGPALEVGERRAVLAVDGGDLAGEDRDALAVRGVVVERDVELVLGEDEPGDTEGLRHRGIV
jgi:hypothetical protein